MTIYKILFLVGLLVCRLENALAGDRIEKIDSVESLRDALKLVVKPKSLILIDVDDTIVTPQARMFSRFSPDRGFISDLITKRVPQYQENVSFWYLHRKIKLVSEYWPDLINDLKNVSECPVFGILGMDSGSFGAIKSVEETRLKELSQLQIQFTNRFLEHDVMDLDPRVSMEDRVKSPSFVSKSIFFGGIFLTGGFSKEQTVYKILNWYLSGSEFGENSEISQFIYVDDNVRHCESVAKVADELKVPYKGIWFNEVEKIAVQADPRVVEYQKRAISGRLPWLEDDQVKAFF